MADHIQWLREQAGGPMSRDSECIDTCNRLAEIADELEGLRAENTELHNEISFYEALANGDEKANWPHRDGRFRDWLIAKIRTAAGGES